MSPQTLSSADLSGAFADHEAVILLHDEATDLRGFIAIHNTNLGPAVGGTRIRYYKNESEALEDALRLSRAMTYKCAIAGVPFGGGKAVIMAPKHMNPREKQSLLRAYTKRLKLLDGHFYTGEDVGLSEKDIELLERYSDAIIGRPKVGDLPARWAALSVYSALEAALEEHFGSASFEGRTFGIKGLGNVGSELCGLISARGGTLVVADIDSERVRKVQKLYKVRAVPHSRIHAEAVDVFMPCALGGDLTAKTIPQLRCAIVCGAANNQLATKEDGHRLHARGILYIPDYVANAGGLLNVVAELHARGYSRTRVMAQLRKLKRSVSEIIVESRKHNVPTSDVADALAEKRFRIHT
jgi:leucine dehydrogenase